ncbi:hypothetical protein [Ruegeria atlantica]|uniref:Uncharacterized protein n=1 Tax=Ruegeria atlantica TaxID=81569 RepID=A0ABX1WE21_9RHOB|nr:hypothetical protein [Ruegeria atlantica]NOD31503.1 hypothetical protein [Ruegeria atlantica]
MHFGFPIEPGKAQPAAIFLEDFVKDVRGNLDKALDWQRKVEVGQHVLYVDVEAGALTGRHEDTDVVTVTHGRRQLRQIGQLLARVIDDAERSASGHRHLPA